MSRNIDSQTDWNFIESAFKQHPEHIKLVRPNIKYQHVLRRLKETEQRYACSTMIGEIISDAPEGLLQRKVVIVTRDHFELEKTVTFSPEENAVINAFLKRIDDNDSYSGPVDYTDDGAPPSNPPLTDFNMECFLFRKVVGAAEHSILKMSEDVYAVKGGKNDLLGKGGFAKVKTAEVHFSSKTAALFSIPSRGLVVRSADPMPKSQDRHTVVAQHNLDNSLARAERQKRNKVRRYSLHEKADLTLKAFILKCQNEGSYNDDLVWKIAISVVREVYRFHQRGFAHRDIKDENFLVFIDDHTIRIKLTDMDLVEDNLKRVIDGLNKGSPFLLPKLDSHLQCSHEQLDEFSLRRVLSNDLENAFCYNVTIGNQLCQATFSKSKFNKNCPTLVSIFSEQFLQSHSTLRAILDTTNGAISARSVGELLCVLLLEKYNLLNQFGTKPLPAELVSILLEYQEKDPEATLLTNATSLLDYDQLRRTLFQSDLPRVLSSSSATLMPAPKERVPDGALPLVVSIPVASA